MKVVNFTQIKDELINNMRRKMLIPVIGSGFTRGCDAYKGKVPSGKDSEYMISKIVAQLSPTQAEIDSLKRIRFLTFRIYIIALSLFLPKKNI